MIGEATVERAARALEKHRTSIYEWTDEQFETWFTRDRYFISPCGSSQSRKERLFQEVRVVLAAAMESTSDYLYSLTTGDLDMFIREARNRGVRLQYVENDDSGWRLYRIPKEDVYRLPYDTEKKEHYLGSDEVGYSIYPMADAEEYRVKNFKGQEWKSI